MTREGHYGAENYQAMIEERENFKPSSWEFLTPEQKLDHFEKLLSYGDLLAILGDQRTERVGETPYNNYFASTDENEDLLFFGSTTSNRFSPRNRELLRAEAEVILEQLKDINSHTETPAQKRYELFNEYLRQRFESLSRRYVEVLPIENPENIHVAFLPSGTEAELLGIMVAKGMNLNGKVVNVYLPYAGTSTAPEAQGAFGNSKNWQGETRKTGTQITGLEVDRSVELEAENAETMERALEELFEQYAKQDPKPTLILHYIPGNKFGREIGNLGMYAAMAKIYDVPILVNIDDAQGRINENKMQDLIEDDYDNTVVAKYVAYRSKKNTGTYISRETLKKEAEEELKKMRSIFAFSVSKSYGVVPFAGVVYYDDKEKQALETYLESTQGLNADLEFYANSQMLPGVKGAKRKNAQEIPNLPLLLKLSVGIKNMEEFQQINYAERRLIFGSLSYAARAKLEGAKGFNVFSETNPVTDSEFEKQDLDTVVTFSLNGSSGPLNKKDLDFIHGMLAKGEVPALTTPTSQAQEVYYRKALQLGAPLEDKKGGAYMRMSFSAVDAIEIHSRVGQLLKMGVKPNEAIAEAIAEKIEDISVALNMVQNAVKIYESMKAEQIGKELEKKADIKADQNGHAVTSA